MKKIKQPIIKFFRSKSLTKYLIVYVLVVVALVIIFVYSPDVGLKQLISSFTGAMLALFTSSVYKVANIYFEDQKKIHKDLEELAGRYDKEKYLKTLEINGSKTEFLYDECFVNKRHDIVIIDDPEKQFEVDETIKNYYFEILKAHQGSFVRNEQTVRLDDYKVDDRTIYFLRPARLSCITWSPTAPWTTRSARPPRSALFMNTSAT